MGGICPFHSHIDTYSSRMSCSREASEREKHELERRTNMRKIVVKEWIKPRHGWLTYPGNDADRYVNEII
jgi:hypothetical protein